MRISKVKINCGGIFKIQKCKKKCIRIKIDYFNVGFKGCIHSHLCNLVKLRHKRLNSKKFIAAKPIALKS